MSDARHSLGSLQARRAHALGLGVLVASFVFHATASATAPGARATAANGWSCFEPFKLGLLPPPLFSNVEPTGALPEARVRNDELVDVFGIDRPRSVVAGSEKRDQISDLFFWTPAPGPAPKWTSGSEVLF